MWKTFCALAAAARTTTKIPTVAPGSPIPKRTKKIQPLSKPPVRETGLCPGDEERPEAE